MLYVWVENEKVAPSWKSQRTTCRECGGTLFSVIPVENVHHCRHKCGDCDTWSDAEAAIEGNWGHPGFVALGMPPETFRL